MSNIRKAGDYEIIHEMRIGEKEVVVGELPYDSPTKYMCAFYSENGIIGAYSESMASDNYAEIIALFAERVKDSAEKAQFNLESANVPSEDKKPFDYAKIQKTSFKDSIENAIVVINPDALRREYRAAIYQLKLCTGGFGAHSNARGSACYCTDLFTGKTERYERRDILGTVNKENVPEWAIKNLEGIQKIRKEKESRSLR